jgi:hypothetical protein
VQWNVLYTFVASGEDIADSLKIRENSLHAWATNRVGALIRFHEGFAIARDLGRGLLVRDGEGRVSTKVHGTIDLETAKL